MCKNSQSKKKRGFLSMIGAFFEAIAEILGEVLYDLDD